MLTGLAFRLNSKSAKPGTRAAAGTVRAWISTGTIHSSAVLGRRSVATTSWSGGLWGVWFCRVDANKLQPIFQDKNFNTPRYRTHTLIGVCSSSVLLDFSEIQGSASQHPSEGTCLQNQSQLLWSQRPSNHLWFLRFSAISRGNATFMKSAGT